MILFLITWCGGIILLLLLCRLYRNVYLPVWIPTIALVAGVAFVALHMELNYRAWDDPSYVSERHITKVTEVTAVIITAGENKIPYVILPEDTRMIRLQENRYFQRNIEEGEKFYFVHHGWRFIGPMLILPSRVLTDTKPEFSPICNTNYE